MGQIVDFCPHGRASAASAASGRNSANASNVMWSQPFSAAIRTISGQRRPGMKPRMRQVLTVEGGTPSPADTAPVPPRSSIAESTVTDMDGSVVRKLRTCQEFATCETTISTERDEISTMPEALRDMSKRLIATREALGYTAQSDFCREIGVNKNVYNPFEKAKRPITLAVALKIKKRFGIPLDWTLDGDPQALSGKVYQKLGRVAA